MWDVLKPVIELYGLPVGFLLVAVLGLAWAWKKERDDNRTLNEEMRRTARDTTTAIVAVKEASEAQRDTIIALEKYLSEHNVRATTVAEKHHDKTLELLENIDKRLIEIATRMES